MMGGPPGRAMRPSNFGPRAARRTSIG
ncbi:hypothetical protein EMIT0111MI5_30274 [Burkholderia sp. IT-111MI5]